MSDAFSLVSSDDASLSSFESYLSSASSEAVLALRSSSDHKDTLLHAICRSGAIGCARLLLAKGASHCAPNADNAEGRTPLHLAADLYREDTTGSLAFEEIFEVLVNGGCGAVTDSKGKLPDVGDDATAMVTKPMEAALKNGRSLQKEIDQERKNRARAIFDEKLDEHISNQSACSIAVCDTVASEGYQFGSRG